MPLFLLLLLLVANARAADPTIFQPPHEHPRLYLRTRDLPDVRQRMTNPVLQPVWQELQSEAKHNTQVRLELDALRYLLDHDDALGRRTIADTLALVQRTHAQESRKIGRMMDTAAMVYDWCYPLLTDLEKQVFIKQLLDMAKNLECGYPPDKGSFVIGHPSEWMIERDMLSAGVAIFDEFPEMYSLAAGRFFSSHLPARNWFYPGHAHHQGTGYADARFVADMYPLFIFDRMGAGNIYNPEQQFVPYEYIYEHRPDGQYMRHGDGQNWPAYFGPLLCASYYHDGYLYANYLEKPGKPYPVVFAFLTKDPGDTEPIPDYKIYEFLWRDPNLKPKPLTDLPLSHYSAFPFGWMVARTGWGADSVIADMRVNIVNFSGHQHQDGGSFELYYKGPLTLHTGVYQGVNGGFGSPHHGNYYKRTIAHNSLLIYDPQEKFPGNRANDGGQKLTNNWREPLVLEDLLKGDFKTGEVLGEGWGPDAKSPLYTYLKGNLTRAYSAKVSQVQRSFVFLNLVRKDVPAALVVLDRVVASNPAFTKYWLLHSINEPVVEGNTTAISLPNSKLINTTLLPAADNARIEKVGGPGKEFWVFGKNYPNAENPPDPEAGAWRIELAPKQPAATDLFLNVLQVMDPGQTPLPAEKIESQQLTGVHIADRVVLFNPAGTRTDQPVSFVSRGNGTLHYLLADLAPGTWKIGRSGRTVEVSAETGTAYFEGPAGSYTLSR
jgi:heparin/heparan-sulfate lyase